MKILTNLILIQAVVMHLAAPPIGQSTEPLQSKNAGLDLTIRIYGPGGGAWDIANTAIKDVVWMVSDMFAQWSIVWLLFPECVRRWLCTVQLCIEWQVVRLENIG